MGYEPVAGIRPVAPVPSLLSSAGPLPAGINWSTGISWVTGCQPSYNWPDCPDSELLKSEPGDADLVHTVPFTIYTPNVCSLPVNDAELEAGITALTEVHTAAQLAAALWMGDGYGDDAASQLIPTLRRSATNVSAATPLDLDDGVSQLLVHYSLCTGGSGGAVLHVPAGMIPQALGGGPDAGRVCWPEGNLYRGPLGSVVSPGPGYPEGFSVDGPDGHGPLLDPDLPDTFLGNEAGTAWIYVTGPVEYAVEGIEVLPPRDGRVGWRTNIWRALAERRAIIRFDPCCVFATEVWNPAPLLEVS